MVHKGAFENARARVIIADGFQFVQDTQQKFDVIIVDSTDPEEEGPSAVLYQTLFYQSCKQCLNLGGVMVTQNGHPQFEAYPKVALSHLASCFNSTTVYQFCVPTYLGGLQTFGWASDNSDLLHISVQELTRRWEESGISDVKHYTPNYHKSCFVLPKWLVDQVQWSVKESGKGFL